MFALDKSQDLDFLLTFGGWTREPVGSRIADLNSRGTAQVMESGIMIRGTILTFFYNFRLMR